MAYGCTVNQHVYIHFLRKNLRPEVWQMWSQILDCVIMLYDNAYPHIALLVTAVFQEYNWEMLNHPPYSPDFSLVDYNLFLKLNHSGAFVSAN